MMNNDEPRPISRTRKMVGLVISVVLIAIGTILVAQAFWYIEKFTAKFLMGGGALITVGIMWIVSDWFDD